MSRWLLRHRHVLALVAGACCLLAALGIVRLSLSTDYRAYFSPDNPQLRELERLEQTFSRNETVIVAVQALGGDVFTPSVLRAVDRLTRAWPELPYATGSASLTEWHDAFADGDTVSVRPLVPAEALTGQADLAAIRARALSEPRLVHGLLSPQGDVTGVVFSFELPHAKPAREIRAVAEAVRRLLDETAAGHPDVALHAGGVILFNDAMGEAIGGNARGLYPLALLVMLVLLGLTLRARNATAGAMLVALMAVLTTLGAAGWLGITLTAASVASGVIVLTLALADCVHLSGAHAAAVAGGRDPLQATAESLQANLAPIALTSITTAIGFLGMNFSASPPFRDLGNLVALGVVAAWLYTLAVMPALLARTATVAAPPRPSAAMAALSGLLARRRTAVALVTVALLLALASGLPRNRFGDNYVAFFPPDHPFRVASEFMNERLTGMQYIEYGVFAGEPGAALEPALLAQVADFVDWLRAQPEVVKVSSVHDVLRRLNQVMHGDDPAFYRLPDSREMAAQYLLFYELGLPAGTGIDHLIDPERSALRLSVQLRSLSSGDVRALDRRAAAWQQAHWPATLRAPGAGITMMFAHIAEQNFRSMLSGTAIAFALIALLLVAAFGSPSLAALSLVPNLLPVAAGFGLWGWLDGELGMSLAVVVSLTLGIVVDDTIHLIARWARLRRQGLSVGAALDRTLRSVGTALCVTSAVLVGGFAVLASSDFSLTADLGLLAGAITLLALACDLLMLPALLAATARLPRGGGGRRRTAP